MKTNWKITKPNTIKLNEILGCLITAVIAMHEKEPNAVEAITTGIKRSGGLICLKTMSVLLIPKYKKPMEIISKIKRPIKASTLLWLFFLLALNFISHHLATIMVKGKYIGRI